MVYSPRYTVGFNQFWKCLRCGFTWQSPTKPDFCPSCQKVEDTLRGQQVRIVQVDEHGNIIE